jgi:hypothetical protein
MTDHTDGDSDRANEFSRRVVTLVTRRFAQL